MGEPSCYKDVIILHSPGEAGRCQAWKKTAFQQPHPGFSVSNRNGWCKTKSHTKSCCLSLSDQSALLLGPTQEEMLPCSSQCQISKYFIAENRKLCIWQRGKPRQAKVVGFVGEPIGNGSQGWITENRLCVFSESSPAGCIVWLALKGLAGL